MLIYQYTEQFPASEKFGLTSQIRRASVSVVLNIVEGYRRKSRKDYLHFLNIADGSLTELEAALELSLDLQFLDNNKYLQVENKRAEIAYLLLKFIKSLEQ